MAPVQTGMDKNAMKALLKQANADKRLRFAIGTGKDPNTALLVMDKIKAPRAVEDLLMKDFPDARNTRFGTAYAGGETPAEDKLVRFYVNKPPSGGMAKRLIKTLKGTGFSKVKILLADDETELEGYEEEDELQSAGIGQRTTESEGGEQEGVEESPQTQPLDAASLQKALAELIPKIPAASGGDSARLDKLKQLAGAAMGALKSGDLQAATTGIETLRKAIEEVQPTSAPSGGPVAYGKSRLAWLAVRKKIESDINTLGTEIVAYYKDRPVTVDLEARYREKVMPVLETLDERLADTLDAAVSQSDAAKRADLVKEAKTIIFDYLSFVSSNDVIKQIDQNPFVPLAIQKSLVTTLSTIAAVVK